MNLDYMPSPTNHSFRPITEYSPYTITSWRKLCREFDDCCVLCGETKPLTRDHIVPLGQGGEDVLSNLQPLCKSCNVLKDNKSIDFIHASVAFKTMFLARGTQKSREIKRFRNYKRHVRHQKKKKIERQLRKEVHT